jgi:AAA family ATP:ADP antiporter
LDASSLTNAFYLVAGFEILRKAAHHVFEKPAREVLFTVVTREEKYKAKEFLDVSVYRGGDCGGGWIYAAFHSAGRTLPAWSAVPLSALAFFVSGFLAREQRRLGEAKSAAGTDVANRG